MKKFGILLLMVLLLSTLLFACNREDAVCEHTFGEWTVSKAATCTLAGEETRVCTQCGKSEQRPTDALGHDTVSHEAKAATCTEDGNAAYETCTRCDYTTYVAIPKLGHDTVSHEAKAATCTEDGYKAYETCTRCDYTTYEVAPKLGHDTVSHEVKPATCTEDGYEAYETCTRCDYTTYRVIGKLNHDVKTHERIEPTYTKAGYEPYEYCTRGDWEGEKTTIPAKGFTYREVAFDLFALPRYLADGATIKVRLIYADDPDQIVSLTPAEFTRLTGSLPMGAEKLQLLRYDAAGTTLWEQTGEYPFDGEVTAYMLKADDNGFGIYPYEEPDFLYISFIGDGQIVTGGERFGIYFFNAGTGASTWVQASLNANGVARLVVPDGMDAFKILRTSLTDAPLSWDCDYWGGTGDIAIGEDNYYILTDWNSGNLLGTWGNWNAKANLTINCNDTVNGHVTADRDLTGIPSGTKVTLTVTADAGYIIKQVTVNGQAVDLNGNTLTVYVTKDMTIEVTVEAGADTSVTVRVDLSAVCQGNEIFGIYFYNTETGENEWKKATLDGKIAILKVDAKYNAFKILRTDPATAELSWSSPWWGQSQDIVLEDGKTLYVVTVGDGAGHWGGAWEAPLPSTVTIDFSGVTLPDTVTTIGVSFVSTETFETVFVAATFDGTIATVAVPEGMTTFHVYCLAEGASLSEDGYTGLGQTGDITLVGGADRYVVSSGEGDVFGGAWSAGD